LWGTSFVALSNKESFQVAINAFDQGGRGYPHSDTGQARFWLQVSEIQNLLAYKAHPDGKDIFSNDGGETPNLSD
jgi:hypothetical protein